VLFFLTLVALSALLMGPLGAPMFIAFPVALIVAHLASQFRARKERPFDRRSFWVHVLGAAAAAVLALLVNGLR
jgi:hypothetical protein